MSVKTVFASMDNYTKGNVQIIGEENPENYLLSNMFEVAASSSPWERVIVARNLEFTVEVIRSEGDSPWYICAHDETLLVMQGAVDIVFVDPDDSSVVPAEDHEGSVRLDAEPGGKAMGRVKAGRGHLTLLPAGAAYQVQARENGVLLLQTVDGDESIEKWKEICQQ